jgi:2-polyprenyl-6-hydroxyphenyl methylase / 3-demethylubiquinone-9 3-methyltransferase
MVAACLVAIGLQALAMLVDEGWFHRRRGLPRWERLGHPLDTLTLAGCLAWLVWAPPDAPSALPVYAGLAIGSIVFVTKDEPIHHRLCTAGEQWLHAVLFALHPIVLGAFAWLWWTGHATLLVVQLAVTLGFAAYQVVYWNVWRRERRERPVPSPTIDNHWYSELGDRWYRADDTPIALLRAESRHRNPWIAAEIARTLGAGPRRVLDLGCGAGFLANDLAARGHRVTGLDADPASLVVAARYDATRTVRYEQGDARALPYPDRSFDVVCAMDLLEHVADPAGVVAEASRVLAPSGMFFFHTFNRTWQANLIVIKGVELFVRNTPKDLHVLGMFVTPEELAAAYRAHALEITQLHGSRPRLGWPLWRMLITGRVGEDFAFTFCRSTKLGYSGIARPRTAGFAGVASGLDLPRRFSMATHNFTVSVGDHVFLDEGGEEVGAVRKVERDHLIVYIEAAGDFIVRGPEVRAAHHGKVVLAPELVEPRLLEAAAKAHERETD